MATLYYRKERKQYYVRWRAGNSWKVRALGTGDKREAERLRRGIEKELAAEEKADAEANPPGKLTFEAFREKYRKWAETGERRTEGTIQQNLLSLKQFEDLTGRKTFEDVTPDDVEHFAHSRISKGVRARTVNDNIRRLKGLWTRAKKSKWTAVENPFRDFEFLDEGDPEERDKVKFLNRKQTAAVLEAAELYSRDIYLSFALGIYAGLRKGEIDAAEWGWIDFEAGVIHVRRSQVWKPKSGKSRKIELAPELADILRFYKRDEGYIIAPGTEYTKDRYRTNLIKSYRAIFKKAAVPWASPHALRHTYAVRMVSKGESLEKIRLQMGHSDPRTTTIYSDLDFEKG